VRNGKLDDLLSVIESGKRSKGCIDSELTFGIPSIGAENINGIGVYDLAKTKFIREEYGKKTKLKNFFRIFFATLHSLLYFCRRFEGHINCLFKQFIFNEITDL